MRIALISYKLKYKIVKPFPMYSCINYNQILVVDSNLNVMNFYYLFKCCGKCVIILTLKCTKQIGDDLILQFF